MGDEEARAVYRKIDFDRLLQKCYTVDFLSKMRKVNEGEVQQYYIEKSHQPIIQPHEFDVVQAEFARRKGMDLHYSGGGVFFSRLVCDDCGIYYGPKVWHSNSKYRVRRIGVMQLLRGGQAA